MGLVVIVALFYVAPPILVIWGWSRWVKRSRPQPWQSIVSAVSLSLTTTTLFLALVTLAYAEAVGGFPYGGDPTLLGIYRAAFLLAISAIITSLIGMVRPGPLQALAPVCATGAFVFWLIQAAGE